MQVQKADGSNLTKVNIWLLNITFLVVLPSTVMIILQWSYWTVTNTAYFNIFFMRPHEVSTHPTVMLFFWGENCMTFFTILLDIHV